MKLTLVLIALFNISCLFAQNPVNEMYKGEAEGPHTDLHINGKVRCAYKIQDGNLHGSRVCYYNNGNLWVVEQFEKGMFNGTNYLLNKAQDTVYIEKYSMDTLNYTKNFDYYRNKKLKSIAEVWYSNDSTLTANPYKTRKKIDGVVIDLIETEENINHLKIITLFDKTGKITSIQEYRSK